MDSLQQRTYQVGYYLFLRITKMNENMSVRLRRQRLKTTGYQGTQPSLLLSLQSKLNSSLFRQEICKVTSLLHRNSKDHKHFTNNRTSLARRTVSQKIDLGQKAPSYYLMDHCNNEDLVSRLLEERGWVRSETRAGEVGLIWGYLNRSQTGRLKGREVLSRVPQSSEMTDKGRLFENLSKYCDKKCISLNFLPITFHFDREGPAHLLRQGIHQFVEFFEYVRENTTLTNTWIMKPTNLNQGREIHLFNTLEGFLKLIGVRVGAVGEELEKQIEDSLREGRSLIVQKYVQNPLLLEGHKFDIRLWAMVDHQGHYYVFEEGYLRFTSAPYRLDTATISNNYVHLTNHSLQKYSPTYSPTHNLQPISILKAHLIRQGHAEAYEQILADMKRIVGISMKATLGVYSRDRMKRQSFQIFGFDFLIDRQLNVRLIEANCNPAITEDCPLLAQLIPKMLNDAFKLTIDRIHGTKNSRSYHVGRLSENAWQKLGEL